MFLNIFWGIQMTSSMKMLFCNYSIIINFRHLIVFSGYCQKPRQKTAGDCISYIHIDRLNWVNSHKTLDIFMLIHRFDNKQLKFQKNRVIWWKNAQWILLHWMKWTLFERRYKSAIKKAKKPLWSEYKNILN